MEETKEARHSRLAAEAKKADILFASGLEFYLNDNYKKAIEFFDKEECVRHGPSHHLLGVMYYYGEGVEKDYSQARWHFYGAENYGNLSDAKSYGILSANIFLGHIYI